MKKIVYIFCVCMLLVLIAHEISGGGVSGQTGSGRYAATAFFESRVKQENEKNKKEQESGGDQKIQAGQAGEKIAYLTFDDGPSENTEKVLKTLKEKNAVATFFLIGKEITAEREDIVKKALEQGNAVGVHTYCHEQSVIYSNKEAFFQDYEQAVKAIERVTGKIPDLYRFPWGSSNGYVGSYVDSLHEQLNQMGVKCFDWNVSGEDSVGRNISREVIYSNVKKDLTKYKQPIILLHDSATMDNTAAELGRIIDYISSEGYAFGTLEDREEYLFPASWRR